MKRKTKIVLLLLISLILILDISSFIQRKEINVFVEQGTPLSNETEFYTDSIANQVFDLDANQMKEIGEYRFPLQKNYNLIIHIVEPLRISFLSTAVYFDGVDYYSEIQVINGDDVKITYNDIESIAEVCVEATHTKTNKVHSECKELSVVHADTDFHYLDKYNYASYKDENELIEDFLDKKGNNIDEISIYYENLVTNKKYELNTNVERFGASTQKLLIAQYYYTLMAEGYNFNTSSLGQSQIEVLLESMIEVSDNDATDVLSLNMDPSIFSKQMEMYGELYSSNSFNQNLLSVDLLKEVYFEIYNNQSRYGSLWTSLGLASKDYHFALELDGIGVYHKYGAYNDSVNDVGIIETPQPFMLIVLSENFSLIDKDLGELARCLYEFQIYKLINKEATNANL